MGTKVLLSVGKRSADLSVVLFDLMTSPRFKPAGVATDQVEVADHGTITVASIGGIEAIAMARMALHQQIGIEAFTKDYKVKSVELPSFV